MGGDRPRPREPYALRQRVPDNVLQRLAELAQPEGLTDDERVQRQPHDERLLLGKLHHLVELIGQHLTEIRRCAAG